MPMTRIMINDAPLSVMPGGGRESVVSISFACYVEHNANLTEWRIDSFEIEYVEIGRAVVWWPVSKMLNRPLHDLLMSIAERQQVSDDIAERLRDAD